MTPIDAGMDLLLSPRGHHAADVVADSGTGNGGGSHQRARCGSVRRACPDARAIDAASRLTPRAPGVPCSNVGIRCADGDRSSPGLEVWVVPVLKRVRTDVVAQRGLGGAPNHLDDQGATVRHRLATEGGDRSPRPWRRGVRGGRRPAGRARRRLDRLRSLGPAQPRGDRRRASHRSGRTRRAGGRDGEPADERRPASVGGRPSASRRRAAATPATPVNCRRPNSTAASGPSARLAVAARNDRTSRWPCRHTSSMIRRRADADHSENWRSATSGPE